MNLLDVIKGGAGIVKDVFDFGKDIFGSDAGKLGLAALAAQQAAKERLPERGGGTKLAYPGPAQLTRTMGVHPTLGTPLAYYDYGPPIQAVGPTAATAATGEEERAALERLLGGSSLGQDADVAPSSSGGGGAPGQGVSSAAQQLGLGLMAYGDIPLMPYGMLASAVGKGIADQQINAMSTAQQTMQDMIEQGLPGLGISIVSDANGNIIGVSSPESIAAADLAMFGPPDSGFGPGGDSGDSGVGPGVGDSVSGVSAGDGVGVYAQGGPVAQYAANGGLMHAYAHGGHVNMEDGGFVLTKRAVDGAGGPKGLAALVPGAQPIRGPGTGTSDDIPATIHGAKGQTPARVSNGEAYVPRDTVQRMGGARQMYNLMNNLQRRA
jgi:hypothetical protein